MESKTFLGLAGAEPYERQTRIETHAYTFIN